MEKQGIGLCILLPWFFRVTLFCLLLSFLDPYSTISAEGNALKTPLKSPNCDKVIQGETISNSNFEWHEVLGYQPTLASKQPVRIRYKIFGSIPSKVVPQRLVFIFSGLMTDLEKMDSYSMENSGFINSHLQDKSTTVIAIEMLGQGETYLQNKEHYGTNSSGQVTPIEIEENFKLAAKVIQQLINEWNLTTIVADNSLPVEIFGKSYGGKIATSISRYLDFQPQIISLFDPGVMTWFQFLYPDLNFKPFFGARAHDSQSHMFAQKIMESLKTTLPNNVEDWRLEAAASLTLGINGYDGTRNILHIPQSTEILLLVPGQQDGIVPKLMTYQLYQARKNQKGKIKIIYLPEAPHNLYEYLNNNPKLLKKINAFKREMLEDRIENGIYKFSSGKSIQVKESEFLEFAIKDTEIWAEINDQNINITFSSLNGLLQWLPFLYQQGVGIEKVIHHAKKELEMLRYQEEKN